MIPNTRISIIAAIDEKRGLGKNNDLLFKISGDMQRLKALTTGHPLVMGRKTFVSLGRKLPNRTHIVITRDPSSLQELSYQPDVVVSSLAEGLEKAKAYAGAEEIFIFGGGQIFTEAIEKNVVDRLYLTVVKGEYGADVFFPDYSMFTKMLKKEEHEDAGYFYTFLDLEK
ncbi:MAG TPA: dihydrofolate reductase [Patescibacteria group bacterium]|nr:dihydrofolate reductase [Patescibacteria group bacterium]